MFSKTNSKGIILFLLLLIILIGCFSYQKIKDYNKLKQIFITEKKELSTDIDKIIANYDKIIDENVKLESSIRDKRIMIIHLKDSLKNLEENNFHLMGLFRDRIMSLEEENKNLFLRVKKLNSKNFKLLKENKRFTKELEKKESLTNNLRNQNNQLSTKSNYLQERINNASQIKITSINIEAKKISENKQKKTSKYNKTDAFEITLVLEKNKIAVAGKKKIHVSIYNSKGKILVKKGALTLNNSDKVSYSAIISFNYNNIKTTKKTIVHVQRENLIRGEYYFKFFSEGSLISNETILLK